MMYLKKNLIYILTWFPANEWCSQIYDEECNSHETVGHPVSLVPKQSPLSTFLTETEIRNSAHRMTPSEKHLTQNTFTYNYLSKRSWREHGHIFIFRGLKDFQQSTCHCHSFHSYILWPVYTGDFCCDFAASKVLAIPQRFESVSLPADDLKLRQNRAWNRSKIRQCKRAFTIRITWNICACVWCMWCERHQRNYNIKWIWSEILV